MLSGLYIFSYTLRAITRSNILVLILDDVQDHLFRVICRGKVTSYLHLNDISNHKDDMFPVHIFFPPFAPLISPLKYPSALMVLSLLHTGSRKSSTIAFAQLPSSGPSIFPYLLPLPSTSLPFLVKVRSSL